VTPAHVGRFQPTVVCLSWSTLADLSPGRWPPIPAGTGRPTSAGIGRWIGKGRRGLPTYAYWDPADLCLRGGLNAVTDIATKGLLASEHHQCRYDFEDSASARGCSNHPRPVNSTVVILFPVRWCFAHSLSPHLTGNPGLTNILVTSVTSKSSKLHLHRVCWPASATCMV
jgi:hypothetical protein